MRQIFEEPKVFLIGGVEVYRDQMEGYLKALGADGWSTDAPSDAEELAEIYGRLCYRSYGVGLNKNVTKVREGNEEYIGNINRSGHGAVIEHMMFNFIFHRVSRIFTHELVRHRVGLAISQESMRYVRINDIKHFLSKWADDYVQQKFIDHAAYTEKVIEELEEHFDIDKRPFAEKKQITSMIRRIAPDGLLTSIGWSANPRTLRHVIPLRTSVHAEEEIRVVFDEVARIMKEKCPNMFADLVREDNGEWKLQS